ncbi:MAG: PA14 domain-containing protein [Planctomycetota bacterium]
MRLGLVVGTLALAAGVATATEEDEPRGVPRTDVLPALEELIARHDCLVCHDPDSVTRERLDPILAPKLEGVTQRVNRDWLVEFLADPRSVRPSTTHPHQLGLVAGSARARIAESIADFLADSAGAPDGEAEAEVPASESSDVGELERGRALFHTVGCVACHGPQEHEYDLELTLVELEELEPYDPEEDEDDGTFDELPPVPPGVFALEPHALPTDLARKYRLSTLAAFLTDPVAVRPSGHCPSMDLATGEARAISAYLLLEQAQRPDGSFERQPGLLLRAYEGKYGGKGLEKLETQVPVATSVVRTIDVEGRTRDDHFGLRFSGLLDVAEPGRYTFHLRSDDGSRLWIGRTVVVDHGGVHGPTTRTGEIDLEAGTFPIEVTFFEAAGGEELSLEWEGPGVERGPLPQASLSHLALRYVVPKGSEEGVAEASDADSVDRGRQAFARLACATCHADVLDEPVENSGRRAPTLQQLSDVRPGVLVCLGPNGRYGFEPEVAGDLLALFLKPGSIAADTTSPEVLARRRLLGRRCYSCHRREGLGGVHPDVAAFYTGDEDAELGDQGRFPPTLTAVGRKFRPDVLRAAVRGEERVRPYLDTRMPRMGAAGVDGLAALLESVDGAGTYAGTEDRCGIEEVDAGRRLAGDRGGLGCVQCHDFRGTRSLGVRAVDMVHMHRRLRFGWFRDLLLDPSNVDLDARMANLWIDGQSPVTDIAEGSIDRQIEALWCWLGEADSMAPPPGLDTGPWAYEIDASQRVRAVSVFMKDVSPRVLCVGTPDSVHYAFDEQGVRLARAWRGRFLNAMGTWKGRAGALETPASADVSDLAPGLAVVSLDDLYEPWPELAGRDGGAQMLSRSTNADGSMTFRYTVGDVQVIETVAPTRLATSGDDDGPDARLGLERRFEVRAPKAARGRSVVARVAVARQFDRASQGRWRLDGGAWPVVEIDAESARTARVLSPRTRVEQPFRGDDDRPAIDARQRGASRSKRGTRPERVLDELRIPVLMAPSTDDPETLVGRFTWRMAW